LYTVIEPVVVSGATVLMAVHFFKAKPHIHLFMIITVLANLTSWSTFVGRVKCRNIQAVEKTLPQVKS